MSAIDEAAEALGIKLLPWQCDLGQRILDGEQVVMVGGRRAGRATLRRVVARAQESAERCSMCRDGVSHSARCHHDEHEVCDRVAEGTDATKSCACPCHSPTEQGESNG